MDEVDSRTWRIVMNEPKLYLTDVITNVTHVWDVHLIGCFNILRRINSVQFVQLADGFICLEDKVSDQVIPTDEVEMMIATDANEGNDDVKLLVNILIIMAAGMVVILICVLALCKQCRNCIQKVICFDCCSLRRSEKCCGSCFYSSYNVSQAEGMLRKQSANNNNNTDSCQLSSSTESNQSNILMMLN